MPQLIIVDPEDRGTQAGTMLPPPAEWKPTPIRERFGEPIDPEADFVLRDGEPCLLFANWDYGEDWSGEFVREAHPFSLFGEGCVDVTPEEWWAVVRRTHKGMPNEI